ncbi:MAG: GtrA family protein [Acholeplasmatales bacterium]|nr:GtrA family protein [Acholeplasmatales bacterium]
MKQSKKEILLEIIRFLIVGGIATLCDYIVYYTFKLVILKDANSALREAVSVFLGFTTGLIVNWVLQKFVYRYLKKDTKKNKVLFIKFTIVAIIGLIITETGMLIARPTFEKLYIHFIFKIDFWNLFFKCLMTGIVLIWDYLARKYLVFKKELKNYEENKQV